MSSSDIHVKKIVRKASKARKPRKGELHVRAPSVPSIQPNLPQEERETKIDITLDMILHDLIHQGHLDPAKSHMFKTQEMREHVGRMCDRVQKMKQGIKQDKDPLIVQTFSDTDTINSGLSIRNNALKPNFFAPAQSNTGVAGAKKKKTKSPGRKRSNSTGRTKKVPKTPSKLKPMGSDPEGISKEEQEQIPRNNLNKSQIQVRPGAAALRMKEKFVPEHYMTRAKIQVYTASVDLRGFSDDHISLEMDGRRLIIVAQRPQNDTLQIHARKVVEIIDIPEGIDLNNLKVGRGSDGSLLIEESLL